MNSSVPQFILVIVLAVAATGLGGCTTLAPTARFNTSTPGQVPLVTTAAAAPPVITLNQLSSGGTREKRDDWTTSACAVAQKTVAGFRPGKIVCIDPASLKPDAAADLTEVEALVRTVDVNQSLFSAGPMGLPSLTGRFEYSVGSIDNILDATGGDALLVILGEDDYFTGDRKAMVALGILAGALTGTAITPGNGIEHLSAVLIARDGTIMWYDSLGTGRIHDLRNPEGVRTTIESLLQSLPVGLPEKTKS